MIQWIITPTQVAQSPVDTVTRKDGIAARNHLFLLAF